MTGTEELREAAFEFQQYLSDRLAPLMVADSIDLLARQTPELMAAEIESWVAYQRPNSPDVSLGDLYFHAARKVAALGDLDLVPRPVIATCLGGVSAVLLPLCPEEERELLRQNIERLRVGSLVGGQPQASQVLIRQPGAEKPKEAPAPTGVLSRAAAQGMKRLSLFLERLRPGAAAPAPPAGAPAPVPAAFDARIEAASQFISTAASQATTAKELEQHLAPLREFGIETATDQVVRALARSLPGWGALPTVAGGPPPLVGIQLNALRQIVSLADAPEDAAKRFRELVHAAIEQFNEGNLGRAVTMFELAEDLVAQEKVKPAFVEPVRRTAHEYLDAERLRKTGERPEVRPGFRKILAFFEALRPAALLHALDGEPKRERRHQLLAMLETHGEIARALAWDQLQASVEPGAKVDPFYQMNLVYLLRVIPRPEGGPVEDEVNVVSRCTGRDTPPPVVKQVIAYLASVRHEKAERALITYLRVFENMLLQPETATYPREDVEVLLDRTCAALARYGSPRSWRALVDHGLKAEPRLGLPMARIVEAGRQDLSGSRDLVERLLAAMKSELPRSVLGFAVKRDDSRILWLIQALSGTPLPEVIAALQEIGEKHKGQKFAEAAVKAVAALTAARTQSAPQLAGDLELFGLPGLLQTIGQAQFTGVLSLMKAPGRVDAAVVLESGRFRGAQYGALSGVDAVHELLERPFPGTFAFVSRTDVSGQGELGAPQDVIGLILEGVRRHDEFKRAAVMIPDRAFVKAGANKPTAPPDEDKDFARRLWAMVGRGVTPTECESTLKVDAYRVRRLLAHWMEQGAVDAEIPAA